MTHSWKHTNRNRLFLWTAVALILLILPITYLMTLAQSLVLGDPTEYTFVANMLGIAHPPGYAFYTLLGKLIQTVVPFGSIAWRMHLLSAIAGTAAALFVFGSVHTATSNLPGFQNREDLSIVAALFAALSVGTAVNYWQHAIHANPHIITAAFLLANLYFLTKWWAAADQTTKRPNDQTTKRPNDQTTKRPNDQTTKRPPGVKN